MDIPRINVIGVGISRVTMRSALDCIDCWIHARAPCYVCCVPAHTVMDCYDHPEIRAVVNQAGLATPDGMSMVWLLRLSGFRQSERVYGPDLMLAICNQSLQKNYRHYFYGGRPEVLQRLVEKLQAAYPGLQIAGCESPPFRPLTPEEDAETVRRIQVAQPDIVWVGIGSPRQEQWMASHLARLNVPVLIGVGAAFDFHSGSKPQAPRWIQRSGLEWFFRLLSEPRRLWKRYLLNYPRFIFLLTLQFLHLKKFPALFKL